MPTNGTPAPNGTYTPKPLLLIAMSSEGSVTSPESSTELGSALESPSLATWITRSLEIRPPKVFECGSTIACSVPFSSTTPRS